MVAGAGNQDSLSEAVAAYRRGDLAGAEQVCRTLIAAHPGHDDASLMLGGLLLQAGRFSEAASVLDEGLSAHPENPRLLVNLSIARRGEGKTEVALELARQAAAQAPELLSGWNALGIALIECGEYAEAEAKLREGLQHHPDAAPLLLHLGHAAKAQGRDEQAMTSYARLRRMSSEMGRQAETLVQSGQLGPAEAAYRQALAAHPRDAAIHAGMGRLLLRLGRTDEAITRLEEALRLDPGDAGSRHFLAAARGQAPVRAEAEYVCNLFDSYAPEFEHNLVEKLGYRVPDKVAQFLAERVGPELGLVLDLGCGTGLMGDRLAGSYRAIDGVDLSAPMLEVAREKSCYRRLHKVELGHFLKTARQQWQTVVMTDVLIYYGRVEALFGDIFRCLEPGGWLAFSIETGPVSDIFLSPASGRYQHAPGYVAQALKAAGFDSMSSNETTIRHEHGQPVPGLLVLARRPCKAT